MEMMNPTLYNISLQYVKLSIMITLSANTLTKIWLKTVLLQAQLEMIGHAIILTA